MSELEKLEAIMGINQQRIDTNADDDTNQPKHLISHSVAEYFWNVKNNRIKYNVEKFMI